MENLEQHDLLSTTQSSNSVREYSEPIPYDLLIDIFSRVPGKSIARFRCLSKLWGSKLGLPYFTELFLTKSLARPRLLIVMEVNKELLFFSSPQPHNPAENSSLVATRYKPFPNYLPSDINSPVHGLVSLHQWASKVWVIYNPLTGESITLPKVEAKGIEEILCGYDPINKKFKALCTIYGAPDTHRVLTLRSTGKPLWRSIECNHFFSRRGGIQLNGEICINGILYYGAYDIASCMIVCFDFSSEKFCFVKIHEEMSDGTLINYKGNLGVLVIHGHEVVLWVLEDAGKHKWCKRISVGLSLYDEIGNYPHFVGMTSAGEIVLSSYCQSIPFRIVYYNIERSTFTRVNIQGLEEIKDDPNSTPRIFLDYVENMKLL